MSSCVILGMPVTWFVTSWMRDNKHEGEERREENIIYRGSRGVGRRVQSKEVGSAEGWTPSTFSSSRDKRAAPKEQRPEDFMDDEDGLLTEQLQAKPAFDTLGSTADEVARKHAEMEATGGAIPGPAPSELIIPVGDPMGKKLLRTMGWREGQGVGNRVRRKRRRPAPAEADDSPEDELPEQARAGLGGKGRELLDKEGLTFAPTNADVKMQSVLAKTNLHGVGHEPFKDAPEFGAARAGATGVRSVYSTEDIVQHPMDAGAAGGIVAGVSRRSLAAAVVDRGSHGFVLDDDEDDVYESGLDKEAYDQALDADGGRAAAHAGLSGSAKAWALSGAADDDEDEPLLASRRYARCPSDGRLPPTGFVVAQRPDVQQKHWAPPIPPANFRPTVEFEDDAKTPLELSTSQRYGGAHLDASGRARLLGEPSAQSLTSTPVAPPTVLDKGKAYLPDGSSALSFLSPAARKKVLEAANATKAPSRFSPDTGAAASKHQRTLGSMSQDNSSQQSEGLPFTLATKFTSETQAASNSDEPQDQVAGIVDPTSRPAGLTLRRPASTDTLNKASTATVSVDKSGRTEIPLLKGLEQRHPIGIMSASASSGIGSVVVTDNGPAERPPIDLFKSIFESESESDSAEEEESEQESTLAAAGEPSISSPRPRAESQRAPHGLFGKAPVDRGYGTDSSEESPGQVEGGHQVVDEAGGAGGEGPNVRGEKTKSARDDDKRRRRVSSSRNHSSRKHGSSKKHKKKHRSEKRDRKHDHKRKKSSSSKRYFSS
ncbi:RNA binding protein, putative [Ectocarpus siliculosus]|uniref:RNA binding protein, putative n=1 Tax=Ectocarpus siliculosus TaxID=2880 RepID=D7FJ14_ECTSI|nr:RNA binding protein, putative [Ectocarpus siliculosus]|eukprot:CBJ49053.1 RNA binding protein, putative [Ectocarpus siliculosus]